MNVHRVFYAIHNKKTDQWWEKWHFWQNSISMAKLYAVKGVVLKEARRLDEGHDRGNIEVIEFELKPGKVIFPVPV